jgi:hypothetical protein
MILWPFIGFAEEGEDALVGYLIHVGLDDRAIKSAGNSTETASLAPRDQGEKLCA